MKNILLVAPYGGVPGGISRWTSHMIKYYNENGTNDCKLDLVPMGRSMFVNINMPVWKRLWTGWIDYRKIYRDFNKKIVSAPYNIMHLTSSGSLSLFKDLYMINKAKRLGIKSIIHFRFGRIPELVKLNNWEWRMIKHIVSNVDMVVVIDQMSYDTLLACGFNNIEILPNPVAQIVEDIISANKNIEREDRYILFAGHVVKTKGVFELLRACSTVPNIQLKLVGHVTDDIRHEIEAIYGQEHTWFSLCGEMPYEDVIKEMMKCDIFVLPTYTEGFPNVILEAMDTGCAIITTPVGAIPQILERDNNGVYGILVEPGNTNQLREAIVALLNDENAKVQMRENVVNRVKNRYNISSIWKRMVDLWEHI